MSTSSIIHKMIAESTKEPDKISITVYGETLLFTRLRTTASIYKIQRDAISQCKVFKKMVQMKDLLEGVDDMTICKSIIFSELNINEEKQSFTDFIELAKNAGPVFTTVDQALDFLMKPQGEIEGELISEIEGNSPVTSITEIS